MAFDNSKYLATVDRRDFVIYAAGLMLKELVAAAPLKATAEKEHGLADPPIEIDHQLKRWPEGYAYTSFCLSVAAAILKEMGEEEPVAAAKGPGPHKLRFTPKRPGHFMLQVGAVDDTGITGVSGHTMIMVTK